MLRPAYTPGSARELVDPLCGGRSAAPARTDRVLSRKALDFKGVARGSEGRRTGAQRRAAAGRLEKVQEKL